MRFLTPGLSRVWRGSILGVFTAGAMIIGDVPALFAADVLFPQPLHITRKIEDPFARAPITVHEYCAGNQIVSVNGDRVSIVDYAKQELTEIDRKAGEYSVTRFDELANAMAQTAPSPKASPAPRIGANCAPASGGERERFKTTALGVRSSRAGRSLDAFEIATTDTTREQVKIEIGVDRNVRLSRAAVEILIGASFPNPRREEHDAILRAAARADRGPNRAQADTAGAAALPAADYGLPVEHAMTVDAEQQKLTFRNTIVDVRNEVAPDDVRAIPPGARRVESRAARMAREMRELDELPTPPPAQ